MGSLYTDKGEGVSKICFLFSGQGAQQVGMGKDFYEQCPEAKAVFDRGDDILGRKLTKIIFEGPLECLTETRNSQPAIFLVSMAILSELKQRYPRCVPSVTAGLSLGEYTALVASGRLSFEEGLRLVQFRADAMNAACEETKGAMAAIVGLSAAEVDEMVRELDLPNDLWVANYNTPTQTVISGTEAGVAKGIEAAKTKGARRVLSLTVHGAFHSGLMQSAQEKLRGEIEKITLYDSPIKLVMNVEGRVVTNLEAIRQNMIQQVTSSVRWEQGILSLAGIELFIEIGCGNILAGMNRQMKVAAPTITINSIQDLERVGHGRAGA
ncbi:MAG: ACP S-malonyltransferase [Chlamydiales bacterium]